MADLKEKTYVEDVDRSVYDIRDAENDAYRMESGLTPEIVEKLSTGQAVQGKGRPRVDAAVPARIPPDLQ